MNIDKDYEQFLKELNELKEFDKEKGVVIDSTTGETLEDALRQAKELADVLERRASNRGDEIKRIRKEVESEMEELEKIIQEDEKKRKKQEKNGFMKGFKAKRKSKKEILMISIAGLAASALTHGTRQVLRKISED